MPRTSIMLSVARSNGDSGYPLHVSSMDVTAAATARRGQHDVFCVRGGALPAHAGAAGVHGVRAGFVERGSRAVV